MSYPGMALRKGRELDKGAWMRNGLDSNSNPHGVVNLSRYHVVSVGISPNLAAIPPSVVLSVACLLLSVGGSCRLPLSLSRKGPVAKIRLCLRSWTTCIPNQGPCVSLSSVLTRCRIHHVVSFAQPDEVNSTALTHDRSQGATGGRC